ncbi:hypothetical protein TNCV_596711 [Trichonephila clavipes]|nr:hypothetical protein TNCV_596711 [Trichonephila clavipes]
MVDTAVEKPFISLQNQKERLEFAKTHKMKTDNNFGRKLYLVTKVNSTFLEVMAVAPFGESRTPLWIQKFTSYNLEGNEITDTLAKDAACEVPEPSAPLTFLEISLELNTRIRPLGLPPSKSTIGISVLVLEGSLSHAGHVCSHPRVPRTHQAGLIRSLAGVGLSESVRCHGPGLALLSNGDVQQQHKYEYNNIK